MEFTLITCFKSPFVTKWEKKLIIPVIILIIIMALYFQNKDGSGLRYLFITGIIFLPRIGHFILKKQNSTLIYRMHIKNDVLSVYNKNAILWRTPVNEITEVILEKRKTVLGIRTKVEAMIIRKENDSFYFQLEGAKFKAHTVNEVIREIKSSMKR